jgi:phage baseplate assembly protein W
MPIYRGFSTVASQSQKKFVLTDGDLIKQDLLNALKTKRGSRLMQPNFGCVAWEKLFQTITASDAQDISDNIISIVKNDPRISLVSIDVNPTGNNITVTLVIKFTATNQIEQLIIVYDQNMDDF